jgi:hypothetical protein
LTFKAIKRTNRVLGVIALRPVVWRGNNYRQRIDGRQKKYLKIRAHDSIASIRENAFQQVFT